MNNRAEDSQEKGYGLKKFHQLLRILDNLGLVRFNEIS